MLCRTKSLGGFFCFFVFFALIVYKTFPQWISDFNTPMGISVRKGRYYPPHGQLRTLKPRKGKGLEVRAPSLNKHGLREKVELGSPAEPLEGQSEPSL